MYADRRVLSDASNGKKDDRVIISSNGYVMETDIKSTVEYYKSNSLCDCEDCRNFRAQAKNKLPKLDAFLSKLGVDIARPDELGFLPVFKYDDKYAYLCQLDVSSPQKLKKLRFKKIGNYIHMPAPYMETKSDPDSAKIITNSASAGCVPAWEVLACLSFRSYGIIR